MLTPPAPSNVVSLDAVRAKRRLPALQAIEQYWETLRGGRLVPARDDIDPTDIREVLGHTFILEQIAPGQGRLRVAGSHMCDLLGMEARGMPLTALMDPTARAPLCDALEAVFSEPAVVHLGLGCKAGLGRPALTGGMVLMPLLDRNGGCTRALGAIAMEGAIGRTPRRPELRSQTRRTLVGYADPTLVLRPVD